MIILFDGECNLCNHSVQWVLLHDKKEQFQFASLQSETGHRILEKHGIEPGKLDTVVLSVRNKLYTRSDAVIEMARHLGGVWSLMVVFKIVPRFIRDAVYNFIGKNRYRWFGRTEECLLPRPEWKKRFIG